MTDTSADYVDFFGRAPPTVMDERPETFARAMEWLLPREHTLRRLVIADNQSRDLRAQASIKALSTLRSTRDRLFRRVAYVLVKKALFLFYMIEEKKYIATNTSFSALIDRAAGIIASTDFEVHPLQLVESHAVMVQSHHSPRVVHVAQVNSDPGARALLWLFYACI